MKKLLLISSVIFFWNCDNSQAPQSDPQFEEYWAYGKKCGVYTSFSDSLKMDNLLHKFYAENSTEISEFRAATKLSDTDVQHILWDFNHGIGYGFVDYDIGHSLNAWWVAHLSGGRNE